jgi:hypothetical protein
MGLINSQASRTIEKNQPEDHRTIKKNTVEANRLEIEGAAAIKQGKRFETVRRPKLRPVARSNALLLGGSYAR